MSLPPNCAADRTRWCEFDRLSESDSHVRERCVKCGRVETYPVRNGRMDNERYRKDHIADFCQPDGPTAKVFLVHYGEEGLERHRKALEERKARVPKCARELAEEAYREALAEERMRNTKIIV